MTKKTASTFPTYDPIHACVPHGQFSMPATGSGLLNGLTFAVKDIFDIAGHPTGAGNPTWLATHPVATHTSPLIEQLLAAGATMTGKVITDELAYSLNGDNMHYGTPGNVNAPGRVPGGSSSGSVAAVAAKLCDFALGSDTGGSTRVPASYCGVWGLRTTHELLSRKHVVPLHTSFDTLTWFAHNPATFTHVGQVLLPASNFVPKRLLKPQALWQLASEDFAVPLQQVLDAAQAMLGVTAETMSFTRDTETLEQWRQAYVAMGAAEAWALHGAWILKHQPTFSAPITTRWAQAQTVTVEQAQAAQNTVAEIRAHVRAVLSDDAIAIVPSAAGLAPLLNESGDSVDQLRMRTMHITCVAGISGVCQVSIPLKNSAGVPVGVSLMGPAGSDLALIRLATALSNNLPA
ncbi:MAG: amidase [Alcaligenaceae bacterium]